MKKIFLSITIAFFWALWPGFSQRYGKGQYMFTFISLGSLLAVAIIQLLSAKSNSAEAITGGAPMSSWLLLPIVLGISNGIAFALYPILLGSVERPSTWVSIVTALLCVFAVIIGVIMTKTISTKEIIGIVLITAGIITMMQK
jgi:uncharacterized membrane protein